MIYFEGCVDVDFICDFVWCFYVDVVVVVDVWFFGVFLNYYEIYFVWMGKWIGYFGE